MNYKICKMKFQTEVHFGRNFLSDNEYSCYADVLFSAMCHEYMKMKGSSKIEDFVEHFRKNRLQISDAFPYIDNQYYFPKPIIAAKFYDLEKQRELKRIPYIQVEKLEEYCKGHVNVTELVEKFDMLGNAAVHVKASIHGLEEANPFWVGGYQFANHNGLYFLIGFEDGEVYQEIEQVIKALSFYGIGGKVTSGYGAFEVEFCDVPDGWKEHLVWNATMQGTYMTLSISLPKEEELELVLKNANYQVVRRGGFVASVNNQAFGKEQRKKDLYAFEAGSCYDKIYQGDIYDVSNGALHPVYRYAKPMFWRFLYEL